MKKGNRICLTKEEARLIILILERYYDYMLKYHRHEKEMIDLINNLRVKLKAEVKGIKLIS